MRNPYKPDEDGITHINIYSKGKTELGRFLSNFANAPFEHPEDGHFQSVEGYWYWLGCKDDFLRTLSGYDAKAYGRSKGAPDWIEGDEFQRKVLLAIRTKINTYPEYSNMLIENILPLTHYYVNRSSITPVLQAQWIIEGIEQIRLDIRLAYSI